MILNALLAVFSCKQPGSTLDSCRVGRGQLWLLAGCGKASANLFVRFTPITS